MIIALLAWLPLSIAFAVLVGKCIKFGSGEADTRVKARRLPVDRSQDE